MPLHDFTIVDVPLYDELPIPIHMNMSRRVIALPPNEDVPATTQLSHSLVMLLSEVTVVKVCARPVRLPGALVEEQANLLADLQRHTL